MALGLPSHVVLMNRHFNTLEILASLLSSLLLGEHRFLFSSTLVRIILSQFSTSKTQPSSCSRKKKAKGTKMLSPMLLKSSMERFSLRHLVLPEVSKPGWRSLRELVKLICRAFVFLTLLKECSNMPGKVISRLSTLKA